MPQPTHLSPEAYAQHLVGLALTGISREDEHAEDWRRIHRADIDEEHVALAVLVEVLAAPQNDGFAR